MTTPAAFSNQDHFKMENKLLRRFVDKTSGFSLKARSKYDQSFSKAMMNFCREKANYSLKEKEVQMELVYLKREKRRFQQMGSVLPNWFLTQMQIEDAIAEEAAKRAAQEKAEALRTAAEKVKERSQRVREKLLGTSPKGPDKPKKDEEFKLPPIKPTGGKEPISLRGKPRKSSKTSSRSSTIERILDEAGKMGEQGEGDPHKQLRYQSLIGRYDPGTIHDIGHQQKEQKSSLLFGYEEEKFDPKFAAKERNKRDSFKKDLLDKKMEYLRGEKLKRSTLPPWLLEKLVKREAMAMEAAEEHRMLKEAEEHKREADDALVKYIQHSKAPREINKDMMDKYLRVLAKAEEKMRNLNTDMDMGATLLLKKEDRRVNVTKGELKESINDADKRRWSGYITAKEMLDCGYLRLTKENIKRLEEMALAEGEDVRYHKHLTPTEVGMLSEAVDNIEKYTRGELEVVVSPVGPRRVSSTGSSKRGSLGSSIYSEGPPEMGNRRESQIREMIKAESVSRRMSQARGSFAKQVQFSSASDLQQTSSNESLRSMSVEYKARLIKENEKGLKGETHINLFHPPQVSTILGQPEFMGEGVSDDEINSDG